LSKLSGGSADFSTNFSIFLEMEWHQAAIEEQNLEEESSSASEALSTILDGTS
jgi:hypothetical protein